MKMSNGGRRLKVEHKFQLLSAGVPPVMYHTIWYRVSPSSEAGAALQSGAVPEC